MTTQVSLGLGELMFQQQQQELQQWTKSECKLNLAKTHYRINRKLPENAPLINKLLKLNIKPSMNYITN